MTKPEEHVEYVTNVLWNTIIGLILNVALFYIVNRFLYSEEDRIPTRKVVEMGVWTFILGSLVWAIYRKYLVSRIDNSPGIM